MNTPHSNQGDEPTEWTFSTSADVLMQDDWARIYAVLKRQIINGDDYKAAVLKACKRILEDYET